MGNESNTLWHAEIDPEALKFSQIELGLKIVASIDPRGWPHLTQISFMRGKTSNELVWGQFTEGSSKKNVLEHAKQGIFIMSAAPPLKFIQLKVDFVEKRRGGEDCEYFSRLPLLRYMTYTNVFCTYHNSVKASTSMRSLSIGGIVKSMLINLVGKGGTRGINPEKKIPAWGIEILSNPMNPKLVSYIDTDGYPVIIPCFQLRAVDTSRLIFPFSSFKQELEIIPLGAHVAVFGVIAANQELINIMINGTLTQMIKSRGIKYGTIQIDEIYNSMPPFAGVIYPQLQIRPKVTNFHL